MNKSSILKFCKDCDDSVSVSEFYIYGDKYSNYCRMHVRERARAKTCARPRVVYSFNEPRPCKQCSPDKKLAPESFYSSRPGHRRNICIPCIKIQNITRANQEVPSEY